MRQSAADIPMADPSVRSALSELAGMRTTMAKVRLNSSALLFAFRALKKLRRQSFFTSPGEQMLLDRAEFCLMLSNKLKGQRVRLPILKEGDHSGKPRLYALMALCARDRQDKVALKDITRVLNGFQSQRELTIAEVKEAINAMQWVLLDDIASLAIGIADHANACKSAKKAAGKSESGAISTRFSELGDQIGFAAQLQRSLVYAPERFFFYSVVCAKALGLTPDAVNRIDRLNCMRRECHIRNALTSLYELSGETDTKSLFNTHPAVMMLLHRSEYEKLDDDAKEYLLLRVRKLAARAGIKESEVVLNAVRHCERTGSETGLLECLWEDNKAFSKVLGVPFVDRPKAARTAKACLQWVALGALTAFYLYIAIRSRAAFLEVLGGAFFGFLVLNTCIRGLLGMLFALTVPARRMPRYESIPDFAKTAVVMAVIAETKEQIDGYFSTLQIQAQAFSEACQFILLCDFPQSGQKEDSLGSALIRYGQELADRLNHLAQSRYLFVTRPRTYVQKEGKWMGKERKFGALMALNEALIGKADAVGVYGGSLDAGIRYVLTLHEDTYFPPGEAQRLVCTLAHPYNARYAVAQPVLATNSATLAGSALARLYAKPGLHFGYDAMHDVQMDLYGTGTYLGQGLYELRRFFSAARDLPEGRLLTHDAITGALANCAIVCDVQALQSFPSRHSSYTKREHRRIRGLWQQAVFLFGVRNKDGRRIAIHAPWNLLQVEQMMDQLVTLATTQLLAIATFSVLPFRFYVLLAFVPYLCPFVCFMIAVVSALFVRTERIAYSLSVRRLFRKVLTDFILCPFDASIALDAIVRTLYRVLISGKKLQQWITVEQAERGDARSLLGYHAQMIPALLFNLLMVVFIRINKPAHLFTISLIAFVWFLSPLLAQRMDKRNRIRKSLFPAFFTNLCRQTYEYFVRMTEDDPFPPRSIWFEGNRISHETTPSDIAFALLSHLCARELHFIDKREFMERTDRLLSAFEALPKWHGHPNERIDLRAKDSAPEYICTLQSANICIALMVTEQALNTDIECELANRAKALWDQMDFTQLFSKKKGFFAKGAHVRTGELTQSYHTMYTSQERLQSYLAIGRKQVRPDHLFRLRREYGVDFLFRHPLCATGEIQEYLWPRLFFALREYTMEQLMMRFAVRAQKKAARKHRRPLGISGAVSPQPVEGVPYTAYGIRRTSSDPTIREGNFCVPYASALMAPIDEILAYDTLCDLQHRGMRCELGFYDALLCENNKCKPIRAMVTIHQGMMLCSLTNLLTDDKIAKLAAKSIPIAAMLPTYECSY